jgi:HEAT repeat protein
MSAISKEQITERKRSNNFAGLVGSQQDAAMIAFTLKNLGHLSADFNAEFLYNLLQHKNSDIRQLAAKNIGKLTENKDAQILFVLYGQETDTNVRRELVSAIGRKRDASNKPILIQILQDTDPKVVCQAIRALLVFSRDKDVLLALKPLINLRNNKTDYES